jgi:NAD(P)-dependent dehydrogenase (short-subunit alcohol dehydrogenase family)
MKTVLITGANRGIGYSFCKHYLEKNMRVIACCRNVKKADKLQELKLAYPDLLVIESLDLCAENSIQNLSHKLQALPVDILINNAGIYRMDDTNYRTSFNAWQMMFVTNTIGPYLMAHALKTNLCLSTEKKIINISSYMASITSNDNGLECPYRASKAALNAITKNLAVEFKADDILCVSLDPGWVRTDMGGPAGLLSADESVRYMTSKIQTLTLCESGQFIQYDGAILPW